MVLYRDGGVSKEVHESERVVDESWCEHGAPSKILHLSYVLGGVVLYRDGGVFNEVHESEWVVDELGV